MRQIGKQMFVLKIVIALIFMYLSGQFTLINTAEK